MALHFFFFVQLIDDIDWQDNSRMTLKEEKTANKERTLVKHEDDMRNVKQETDLTASFDVPEPDRLAGHRPVSVPINQDFNNDIYFIGKQLKRNKNLLIVKELSDFVN